MSDVKYEISLKLKKCFHGEARSSIWSRAWLADFVNLCQQNESIFSSLKIGAFSSLLEHAPLDMNVYKLLHLGRQWKSPTDEIKKEANLQLSCRKLDF